MQKIESQSMLKTGLPYDIDAMTDIAEKGAIVNMADINFPGIPKNKEIRTAFIFLRNTGFNNIELDFSNVSYSQKESFLLEFILGDIECSNHEFVDSWMSILFTFNNIENNIRSILSKQETEDFIKNNADLVFKLSSLIFSISVMLLHRMKEQKWDFDIESEKFGAGNIKNIASIINNENILPLYTQMDNDKYDLIYYSDLFSNEEDELFLSIMKSPIFVIMFGLSITDNNSWQKFINEELIHNEKI